MIPSSFINEIASMMMMLKENVHKATQPSNHHLVDLVIPELTKVIKKVILMMKFSFVSQNKRSISIFNEKGLYVYYIYVSVSLYIVHDVKVSIVYFSSIDFIC